MSFPNMEQFYLCHSELRALFGRPLRYGWEKVVETISNTGMYCATVLKCEMSVHHGSRMSTRSWIQGGGQHPNWTYLHCNNSAADCLISLKVGHLGTLWVYGDCTVLEIHFYNALLKTNFSSVFCAGLYFPIIVFLRLQKQVYQIFKMTFLYVVFVSSGTLLVLSCWTSVMLTYQCIVCLTLFAVFAFVFVTNK